MNCTLYSSLTTEHSLPTVEPSLPLRDRLINAAMDIYLEGGLGALTMRDLGKRTGVSAMAPYSHFDNKDDLVSSIVDRCFEQYLDELRGALKYDDPVVRLRDTGRRVFQFAMDHPAEYHLIYIYSKDPTLEKYGETVDMRLAAGFQYMHLLVKDCADAGELIVDNTEAFTLAMLGMVHGLLALYLSGRMWMGSQEFEQLFWNSLSLYMDKYLKVPYDERPGTPQL